MTVKIIPPTQHKNPPTIATLHDTLGKKIVANNIPVAGMATNNPRNRYSNMANLAKLALAPAPETMSGSGTITTLSDSTHAIVTASSKRRLAFGIH